MKNNIVIELHDILEYMGYGDIYPTKMFIKNVKKAKLDHTAGAGWPVVITKNNLPAVEDNCVIWINDESEPQYSIKSIYDGEIVTYDLSDYQKENNDRVLGVLWVDRLFDIC